MLTSTSPSSVHEYFLQLPPQTLGLTITRCPWFCVLVGHGIFAPSFSAGLGGGRNPSVNSSCTLLGDVTSYVTIMCQIYGADSSKEADEDPSDSVLGLNSAVSPAKRGKAASKNKSPELSPLRPQMKRNLLRRGARELLEVVQFFSLNRGCMHVVGEWYLSTGELATPPGHRSFRSCGSKCPICSRAWHDIFMPIRKTKLIKFLKSEWVTASLPMRAERDNIVRILWSEKQKMENRRDLREEDGGQIQRRRTFPADDSIAYVGTKTMQ